MIMKKQDIHFFDIHRILFGQTPPLFLIEVFFRTLILYIFLLFILRWLGKRMSGGLSIMELAVMLTLGAIVCVPMQIPDRGILQGFVLLLCGLIFQRSLSLGGVLSKPVEDMAHGKVALLVKDGILQLQVMEKERISKQQLFAQLRRVKVFNLGSVERIYLEASGLYSIFMMEKPKPGLSVLPLDDKEINDQMKHAADIHGELMVCAHCGYVKPADNKTACPDCGNSEWAKAII
ncbi:MAG: hypothetical protein JWP94_1079 [Mucilaginibacter sp.]|nr:hypothetical protein [Mucilaginibacter sp.]